MLKLCAFDDVSFSPSSTLNQEQVQSIQATDAAYETQMSIMTSAALDFEQCFDLKMEKDHYKADPNRLKRDVEIIENEKRSLAEATEATGIQQITAPHTISTEQEPTALGLRSEEFIGALPDWLLSDGNARLISRNINLIKSILFISMSFPITVSFNSIPKNWSCGTTCQIWRSSIRYHHSGLRS